jgi:hypothetical protein
VAADPTFSPGSADDTLNEKLKTGDIIVFSRRWYHYHLPQAVFIKLYQLIHDTSYDHLGVIVCDKYGTPYLFEHTFFGGHRVRPFEPRILYSRAHQITAVMIMPRDDDSNSNSNSNSTGTKEKKKEQGVGNDDHSSDVDRYVSEAISKGGGVGGWYQDISNLLWQTSAPTCSKLHELALFYANMGLSVSVEVVTNQAGVEGGRKGSLRDLLAHRVTLREEEEQEPEGVLITPRMGVLGVMITPREEEDVGGKKKKKKKRKKGRYLSDSEVLVRTH